MARRRRARARAPARSAPRRRAPRNRLFDLDLKDNLLSGVYGAGRGVLSNFNPLKNLFGGAGKYADELAMFVGLQAVKTFSRGEIRKAAKLGQNFESALVGFQLSQDMGMGRMTNNNGNDYFKQL